ncbi:gamma-glutamyltransferase [Balneolaceae bacterium ANBcel3]|nr:gamma-glutamyltransferase [Balneolaceae bacterium ANBcel3]
MKRPKGVVAAGHEETVRAAEMILNAGGNAFDAVIAAHLAACVSEPVLSSLAGGGFMLTQCDRGQACLYDFFTHTPRVRRDSSQVNFFPISADFGETQQEFHIGWGSFATPGTVRGLFAIHKDHASMSMKELVQPAVELARSGVRVNHYQAYVLDIVKEIYKVSPDVAALFGKKGEQGTLVEEGDIVYNPELADFLEVLAIEGEDLFYRGEIADRVGMLCQSSGGHITREDMESYPLYRREPLRVRYKNYAISTNPGPSSGGTLIAFALKMLESSDRMYASYGSLEYIRTLAEVQMATEMARMDFLLNKKEKFPGEEMLHPEYLASFKEQLKTHPRFFRGTTHISVMDQRGNVASLTTSNGEGCGHVIPGTGIMMNNMLGEEDLHPHGFHSWPENSRITSMMAPTILTVPGQSLVALGSGGSNRLRTAILQVLLHLTDHNMSLEDAVTAPRIHCEKEELSIEHGFSPSVIEEIKKEWPNTRLWSGYNLFFGGTHAVSADKNGFHGAGDPRRGGCSKRVY